MSSPHVRARDQLNGPIVDAQREHLGDLTGDRTEDLSRLRNGRDALRNFDNPQIGYAYERSVRAGS